MSARDKRRRPILPPPALALLLAALMWSLAQAGFAAFDFPGRNGLAAGVAATGLFIDLVSVAAFIRARTTVNPLAPDKANALVMSGLYRISRNPMYLGMLMILLGWAIHLGDALAFLPAGLFIVLIEVLQIRPEERALEEKFGDDYRAYKKRVRRWI